MSVIGSPIETSLLQAAQAQQVASKARDKEKTERDSSARRFQDVIELRVAGVETADAIRKLPSNESQQAEVEHQSHETPHQPDDEQPGGHIDVQA
jgi:hypothetical protein